MFCPECGSLSYPDSSGNIKCENHQCKYEGPLTGRDGSGGTFTDPVTGETVDLTDLKAPVRPNEFSRPAGGAGNPNWDEPEVRLSRGHGKKCKCGSTNLKPTPGGIEYECRDCDSVVM